MQRAKTTKFRCKTAGAKRLSVLKNLKKDFRAHVLGNSEITMLCIQQEEKLSHVLTDATVQQIVAKSRCRADVFESQDPGVSI